MTTASRPDLVNADGVEVTEYLTALGWREVRTQLDSPIGQTALKVEALGTRDLASDLDAFRPTAARGEYQTPLPADVLYRP